MSTPLLNLPRSMGGHLALVVAEHPAGDRVELEIGRLGQTMRIPIFVEELDALLAALGKARARVLGPARPRLKCGHLSPYGSRGPRC